MQKLAVSYLISYHEVLWLGTCALVDISKECQQIEWPGTGDRCWELTSDSWIDIVSIKSWQVSSVTLWASWNIFTIRWKVYLDFLAPKCENVAEHRSPNAGFIYCLNIWSVFVSRVFCCNEERIYTFSFSPAENPLPSRRIICVP